MADSSQFTPRERWQVLIGIAQALGVMLLVGAALFVFGWLHSVLGCTGYCPDPLDW